MSHNHLHDHGHDHVGHAHSNIDNHGKAFGIAIVLNMAFVVIEFAYGFLANSTALARKSTSERYSYGLRSTSILSAVANVVLLLVACGAIACEAIQRFSAPPRVKLVRTVLPWLEMQGCGRSRKGTSDAVFDEERYGLVSRLKLEIACCGDRVEQVIAAIQESARTGLGGDGKIYLLPVLDAVRS